MRIQGLSKYIDKESYIIQIIKNKKEVLYDIIGDDIKNIYSEVRFNNNKIRVDLVCESEAGPLIFTEVSIRSNCMKDFINHRNQLIKILEFIGKERFAHIILMSPDFLNEDIKHIENLIVSYNVKVYFVFIAKEFISKLENQVNIDFEKVQLAFNKSIIGNCIKVTSKIVSTDNMFIISLNNERCGNDFAKAILKGLREELYWHLAVHRYKNLSNNIIRIGTGTSDIILNIYCNMNDDIKIELDFAQRHNIFNIFKNYMADMTNAIGSSIDIDANSSKMFTRVPILKDKNITILTSIDTAKGYIEYTTRMYKKIKS